MRTINKIITKVDCRRGAPMGRHSTYPNNYSLIKKNNKEYIVNLETKKELRVFDCKVPLCSDGAYDIGGAYWGLGGELRVKYTKDLSYTEYYRNRMV